MKKTILTAMAVLVTGMTAQAKMNCVVLAESKTNEYDKIIASVAYDGVSKSQDILLEGDIHYTVGRNGDGNLGLYVYSPSTGKVYASALAKTEEQLVVLAPELRRFLACTKHP